MRRNDNGSAKGPTNRYDKLIPLLVETGRRVREAGLVTSSSGNLSVRADTEHCLITASGAKMGELTPEEICPLNLHEVPSNTGRRPSMEGGIHQLIYRQRPEVGAILHFQSPWATAICCQVNSIADFAMIPEIPVYVRDVVWVDYFPPGSEELARSIAREVSNNDAKLVLLRNHGQVALGSDLNDVLRVAEFFEFACRLIGTEVPLRTLSSEEIMDLKSRFVA